MKARNFRHSVWYKSICFLFCLLLYPYHTRAQETILYSAEHDLMDVGPYVKIYKDETNSLQFAQIKKLPATAFQQSELLPMGFGNTRASIWLKFTVKNQTASPLFLSFESSAVRIIDAYIYDEAGNLTIRQSGSDRPSTNRDLQRSNVVLNIGQSPKDLYIKIESRYTLRLPLTISHLEDLSAFYHKRDVINGVCVGILIAMALYNLFIFFSVKDRLYLYYCFYVFSSIVVVLHINGVWYLVRTNNTLINHFLGTQFLIIASALFTARFLNLRQNMPHVYTAIMGVCILVAIDIPFDFFNIPFFTNGLVFVLAPLLAFAMLIVGVVSHFQGNKSAVYYVLAWIFYLGGAIISSWSHEGFLPFNSFTLLSLPLGACIETILLSIALANRINIYRSETAQAQALALQRLEENEALISEKNKDLEEKVHERTKELEASLEALKSTQAQLIQSEKLASLGELTAGIAHEIQNPLNFVNNFSEISVELAHELKEEAEKPEIDKELIIDLATDLAQNQSKINLHGKRASSIVSGMLEHSRTSTGERALTDINKLVDEYLRLSYHGIRAKDNSFNSDYKTDFDENLPKIEVIPQDMGRVLLNLINNAFWAVKTVENPLVIVKTEQSANQLIIKVTDNGTGIPDTIKDKIFQPFFTTKPTGQGTGLGLSLAFDIVTKGHGGTLEVESKEGKETTFTVVLPLN